MKQFLSIAITGNIGSGKTEAAKIFEHFGAKVVYSDKLAKELMVSNAGLKKKIQSSFGEEAYLANGLLNRSYLAKEVFSDSKKRVLLDSLVHPVVIKELQKIIKTELQSGKNTLLVVEAALVYEAGIESLFDYVIVVRADEARCRERIAKRDKLTHEEIERRLTAQMESKKKEAKGDFVIDNSGTIAGLQEKCRFIYTLLQTMGE